MQTDALKDTSEETHSPEGLQEQRSGKKYNASLLFLAEADGKAEFRLEFGDTHDAG